MATATKTAPRKATTPEPTQAPINPAPILLGEPAFDVFSDWVSSAAPNADLQALTAEVVTAEQDAARLWDRIPEAKAERRRAAFAADEDDAAALEHAKLGAELDRLPTQIGEAEAKRVDANLRYLACLREYAKAVAKRVQAEQIPLRAEGSEATHKISTDESRKSAAPTMTDAEKAVEESKLQGIGKELRPLLERERLAIEVHELTAIRALPFGRNLLRDYQDRLILLNDFGRGVAVEAAREQAQKKAEAQIKA